MCFTREATHEFQMRYFVLLNLRADAVPHRMLRVSRGSRSKPLTGFECDVDRRRETGAETGNPVCITLSKYVMQVLDHTRHIHPFIAEIHSK